MDDTKKMEWETAIPLLANPFLWGDFLKALAVALSVFGGIIVLILADDDRPDWAGAAGLLAIAAGVVAALFVFVELAVFRNRLAARFTLDDKAAAYESGRIERRAQKIGFLAGFLAGSPLVAGSSLLASSMNRVSLSWSDVRKVTPFPERGVITLSNRWRPVLRLYCPSAETYEAALRLIGTRTAARGVKPS
jgi:hypothetical protein